MPNDDEVLVRFCPMCNRLYGEHSLDALAWCMEEVAEMLDYEAPYDATTWRPVETVTGPTMALVL